MALPCEQRGCALEYNHTGKCVQAQQYKMVSKEETDRWWQVFCSSLRPSWDGVNPDGVKADVVKAADVADQAIAEAKKRGRL